MLALLTAAALAVHAARWSSMEAAVDAAAAQGLAGEVLVTDRNHTLYARAVSAPGRAHRRGELWRWASVTKQLTAVLVLQAVDAGRLRLDDTVRQRLPDFRGPTAGEVTLRQLLQHTSGLPDPDATSRTSDDVFPAFYVRPDPGVGGIADALGFCAGEPRARPGAGFHYDNCDYIVLGAVLERAEGASLRSLFRERLGSRVGAPTLDLATTVAAQARLVHGRDEAGRGEPPFNLASFGAAGAADGRPEDHARFDRAWLQGRLMSAASRAAAEAGDPKLGYVGLGVWGFSAPLRGCTGAVRLVERRGEIGGVEVRNLLAPDLGRALVVFADRAGLDFGEVWQGKGLTYRLASAAFCPAQADAAENTAS